MTGRTVASPARPSIGISTPATVFLPPGLPAALVERRRLEDQLGAPGSGVLSIVIGPPGSGKTTLIRAWLRGAQHSWCWVTLDEPESGSDITWLLLVRAIQRARPALVLDVTDLLSATPLDPREIAATVANDLVAAGLTDEPLVVVIDDAHLLSPDGWTQVAWLAQHQPAGLQLVLASRVDPPFSLARMRAAGIVSTVRPGQLAFDQSESRRLFTAALGDSHETVRLADALYEQTEGWAAGLRLALLALQGGTDRNSLESDLGGWRGTIAELLVAEVLDRQPADVRHFLRCTSIVPVLEPGLCDALSERSDSSRLLRELASHHVFLSPIEDLADRYRYHPMLAQLLLYEVRATEPELEGELHRRAARWHETNGDSVQAIDHFVAAGAEDAAFDLIMTNLQLLHREGRRDQVAAWLSAVPDDYLAGDPDRVVKTCGALLLTARRQWFDWWLRAQAVVDEDRPDLRRQLDAYRAVGHATQGRIEEFDQLAPEASPETANPFDEILTFWRAQIRSLDGVHDEAIAVASSLAANPRVLIRDPVALSLLAGVLHASGEDERATAAAERAVQLWQELGEPDLLGMVDALCVRSLALREAGELDAAEDHAATALAVCDEPPPHLLTIRATLALSAVDDARGDHDRARRRVINVAEDARLAGVDPRLLRLLDDRLEQSFGSTDPTAPESTPLRPADALTQRELAILPLLRSHLTFPEIGQELYISRYTVKTHVSRIYRKLGVTSRSAAIHEARRRGLLG